MMRKFLRLGKRWYIDVTSFFHFLKKQNWQFKKSRELVQNAEQNWQIGATVYLRFRSSRSILILYG